MKKIVFEGDLDISIVKKSLSKLVEFESVSSLFILMTEEGSFDENQLQEIIPKNTKTFGGIFPNIINENRKIERGVIILGFSTEVRVTTIENLSGIEENLLNELDGNLIDEGFKTLLVFADGYSKGIENLIESLFITYGIEVNYIGGGCGGFKKLEQKPCIISGGKLLQDAAVIGAIQQESSVGVKHGWDILCGPFKVNKSEGNIVHYLEDKKAFDLYKEVVESDSNQKVTNENFHIIAKHYPFGISKLGSEKIIRDPFQVNADGSLTCFGEIPNNAFLHIMKGTSADLLEASKAAINDALQGIAQVSNDDVLLFIDCISRALFLGENFQQELDNVINLKIPAFGALTLGEIANNGKDFLEFYNKTCVAGIIKTP